jgi:tetratricopeptide (TPR) repeat protein
MFAWMRLGRHDSAMDACRRGRALFPHDPEVRFREAVMLQELGRFDEVSDALDRALVERPNDWATLCERSRRSYDSVGASFTVGGQRCGSSA